MRDIRETGATRAPGALNRGFNNGCGFNMRARDQKNVRIVMYAKRGRAPAMEMRHCVREYIELEACSADSVKSDW